MLLTAALHLHMDCAARGLGPSPSSSSTSPPPWLPAVLADDNHRHQLPCDLAASAPSPAPATAAPQNHHHHHLRPAARRVAKRRPRPSRKLPTTYITADPASFRRMVHQVTGADDLPIISPHAAPPAETLCRPAPSGAAPAGTGGAMLLPTLDTSAFLLGAPGVPAAAPALLLDQAEAGGVGVGPAAAAAGGACNYNSSSGGGGFPTLDSWDALF